jgi:hypothetical protein
LRTAAAWAWQLSQTQVVRSFVLVLMVSPPLWRLPTTVGSCCVGTVTPELHLPTDESTTRGRR